MISTAKLKYLGVSPQKTRLVVDQIRGRSVDEALTTLRYSRKRVAKSLEKLLRSALANAQDKQADVDVDRLVLVRAIVNCAPSLKRARSAPMGRVLPVLKRACHVTFDLDIPTKQKSA